MNFKKIILLINLILMIYSCNAVIVDNYDQSKYTSILNRDLKQIQKEITTITITEENNDTIHVNAFVNEYSVYYLKNLIKEYLNIKTIKYIYNNHFITMSNFEKNFRNCSNAIYSIVNKHRPPKKTKISSTVFIRNFQQELILTWIQQKEFNLGIFLKYLNDNNLGDLYIYYPGYTFKEFDKFYLGSYLISNSDWYIMGKVKGAIDNEFKFIPVKDIDQDTYLYKLSSSFNPNRAKFFISLNNLKFTSDDVGAYILYINDASQVKIFAQITEVHTIKDTTQILLLQLLNNSYLPFNKYTYNQYNQSPIAEGDLSKKPVTYETATLEESSLTRREHSNSEQHNPRKRPNTDYATLENSKRLNASDKYIILTEFTCDNINKLGDYKFNDVIIHVTNVDEQASGSLYLYIYNIKGNYDYGTTINQNFYSCHIGNDFSNNKPFLIINNKTGDGFYPYGVLR